MQNKRKRVLYAIAKSGFRDAEYFIPKQVLTKAGYEVQTISDEKGEAVGVDRGMTIVNLIFTEVDPKDYEALIVAGGPGAKKYFDNQDLHKLINDFDAQDKTIGAICTAPMILARAGILSGKTATVWDSPEYKKELLTHNVTIENQPIVVSKNVITACGPESAEKFGEAIVNALASLANS